eukprot:TRINITY_DN8591_c0_g1_i1.p1 TRINITY_DN8591_c0_g1~~TRINITY_DN8591_c0_g1_i1.p1  ORF type:complete len:155 (+),score=30.02 TRINITY_DN8591_c0_g1_i1:252-716(+)
MDSMFYVQLMEDVDTEAESIREVIKHDGNTKCFHLVKTYGAATIMDGIKRHWTINKDRMVRELTIGMDPVTFLSLFDGKGVLEKQNQSHGVVWILRFRNLNELNSIFFVDWWIAVWPFDHATSFIINDDFESILKKRKRANSEAISKDLPVGTS